MKKIIQTLILLAFSLLFFVKTNSQYHDADVFHSFFQKNDLNINTWDECIDSSWFITIDSNEKENFVDYLFLSLQDSLELFYDGSWMNIYKNYNYLKLNKNSILSNHGSVTCGGNEIIHKALLNDQLYICTKKTTVYDSIGEIIYNTETGELIVRDSIITYSKIKLRDINIGFKWFENWNIKQGEFIKNSNFITFMLAEKVKTQNFYSSIFSKKNNKKELRGNLFKSNVIYNTFYYDPEYNYDSINRHNRLCYQETDLRQGEFSLIISKVLNLIEKDSIKLYELNYGTRIFSKQFNEIKNNFFIVYDEEDHIPIYEEVGYALLITQEERYDGIKFIENWYFDKNNFNIIKDVKGIQLLSLDPKLEEGEIEIYLELPIYISFDGNPPPKEILINKN